MTAFRHSLDPLFHPGSIAVIGASATAGSVGSIVMKNLLENPEHRIIYPVNPYRRAVHGVRCFPSICDVPETVDLAIVATPARTVAEIIGECVDCQVKGAVIISAGFSELGEQGRALEKEITKIAKGRLRIIGPNCLGVLHPPTRLNASFAASMAEPGRVALLSQSGAICTSILDWANDRNIGFSAFVSVGTMIDVDFADLLDYFGDDAHTRSIILYMESIGDVPKFLSAARAVARTKQVIVVKSGRSEASARAAASHTGAMAGSDVVFDTAFRRAGVLRVNTIRDLFHMSELLAQQPAPRGPALAIITNAGGPGVMATDALMDAYGELAELSDETTDKLDQVLPQFWSHSNPIDILGDATPDRYRQVVEICSHDRNINGLLIMLTPQAMTDPAETARQVQPFANLGNKPVLASWMGASNIGTGRRILQEAGIATFDSPEAAVNAFMNMVTYRRNQDLLYQTPAALPEDWSPDSDRVRSIIERVRAENRRLLTEFEAKNLLAAYGIPVTPTARAQTEEEAVAEARQLGYPVVLKLNSTIITHKSDVDGVQLDLIDDQAVRQAFATIRRGVERYADRKGLEDLDFEGVTVQPMLKEKGYELIVGSSVDIQFGPVILFGTGGVLVEVFRDRALGLPPLNRTLARGLLERTQIYKALQGVRGQEPVPLDELETLLVRFSYLLCDFLELQEIDINPLLATPERLIALDARVVLCSPELPIDQRPRPAIQPYPNQLTETWTFNNGKTVTIRALRPEDEPLIIELMSTLSERTIRMRFFSMVKQLSRESLIHLCHLDYARELALIAVDKDGDGKSHPLGVSRYYTEPETGRAEFAIVVSDAFQGQGLGYHLMERLIQAARQHGVKQLVGTVLRDNTDMLRLAKDLGFYIPKTHEEVVEVTLDL